MNRYEENRQYKNTKEQEASWRERAEEKNPSHQDGTKNDRAHDTHESRTRAERHTTKQFLNLTVTDINNTLRDTQRTADELHESQFQITGDELHPAASQGMVEIDEFRYEFYLKAVENYDSNEYISIENIPYEYLSEELILSAVERNSNAITKIPEKLFSVALIDSLIDLYSDPKNFDRSLYQVAEVLRDLASSERLTQPQHTALEAFEQLQSGYSIEEFYPDIISKEYLLSCVETCSSDITIKYPQELLDDPDFIDKLVLNHANQAVQTTQGTEAFWRVLAAVKDEDNKKALYKIIATFDNEAFDNDENEDFDSKNVNTLSNIPIPDTASEQLLIECASQVDTYKAIPLIERATPHALAGLLREGKFESSESFNAIPDTTWNEDLIRATLDGSPRFLGWIPQRLITEEIIKKVEQEQKELVGVLQMPTHLINQERAYKILDVCPERLGIIPERFLDKSLCLAALEKTIAEGNTEDISSVVTAIPKHFIPSIVEGLSQSQLQKMLNASHHNDQMKGKLVVHDRVLACIIEKAPTELEYLKIPANKYTAAIALAVVESNPSKIHTVPEHYRTTELYISALGKELEGNKRSHYISEYSIEGIFKEIPAEKRDEVVSSLSSSERKVLFSEAANSSYGYSSIKKWLRNSENGVSLICQDSPESLGALQPHERLLDQSRADLIISHDKSKLVDIPLHLRTNAHYQDVIDAVSSQRTAKQLAASLAVIPAEAFITALQEKSPDEQRKFLTLLLQSSDTVRKTIAESSTLIQRVEENAPEILHELPLAPEAINQARADLISEHAPLKLSQIPQNIRSTTHCKNAIAMAFNQDSNTLSRIIEAIPCETMVTLIQDEMLNSQELRAVLKEIALPQRSRIDQSLRSHEVIITSIEKELPSLLHELPLTADTITSSRADAIMLAAPQKLALIPNKLRTQEHFTQALSHLNKLHYSSDKSAILSLIPPEQSLQCLKTLPRTTQQEVIETISNLQEIKQNWATQKNFIAIVEAVSPQLLNTFPIDSQTMSNKTADVLITHSPLAFRKLRDEQKTPERAAITFGYISEQKQLTYNNQYQIYDTLKNIPSEQLTTLIIAEDSSERQKTIIGHIIDSNHFKESILKDERIIAIAEKVLPDRLYEFNLDSSQITESRAILLVKANPLLIQNIPTELRDLNLSTIALNEASNQSKTNQTKNIMLAVPENLLAKATLEAETSAHEHLFQVATYDKTLFENLAKNKEVVELLEHNHPSILHKFPISQELMTFQRAKLIIDGNPALLTNIPAIYRTQNQIVKALENAAHYENSTYACTILEQVSDDEEVALYFEEELTSDKSKSIISMIPTDTTLNERFGRSSELVGSIEKIAPELLHKFTLTPDTFNQKRALLTVQHGPKRFSTLPDIYREDTEVITTALRSATLSVSRRGGDTLTSIISLIPKDTLIEAIPRLTDTELAGMTPLLARDSTSDSSKSARKLLADRRFIDMIADRAPQVASSLVINSNTFDQEPEKDHALIAALLPHSPEIVAKIPSSLIKQEYYTIAMQKLIDRNNSEDIRELFKMIPAGKEQDILGNLSEKNMTSLVGKLAYETTYKDEKLKIKIQSSQWMMDEILEYDKRTENWSLTYLTIPEHLFKKEYAEHYVKRGIENLSLIPEKLRSDEICLTVMKELSITSSNYRSIYQPVINLIQPETIFRLLPLVSEETEKKGRVAEWFAKSPDAHVVSENKAFSDSIITHCPRTLCLFEFSHDQLTPIIAKTIVAGAPAKILDMPNQYKTDEIWIAAFQAVGSKSTHSNHIISGNEDVLRQLITSLTPSERLVTVLESITNEAQISLLQLFSEKQSIKDAFAISEPVVDFIEKNHPTFLSKFNIPDTLLNDSRANEIIKFAPEKMLLLPPQYDTNERWAVAFSSMLSKSSYSDSNYNRMIEKILPPDRVLTIAQLLNQDAQSSFIGGIAKTSDTNRMSAFGESTAFVSFVEASHPSHLWRFPLPEESLTEAQIEIIMKYDSASIKNLPDKKLKPEHYAAFIVGAAESKLSTSLSVLKRVDSEKLYNAITHIEKNKLNDVINCLSQSRDISSLITHNTNAFLYLEKEIPDIAISITPPGHLLNEEVVEKILAAQPKRLFEMPDVWFNESRCRNALKEFIYSQETSPRFDEAAKEIPKSIYPPSALRTSFEVIGSPGALAELSSIEDQLPVELWKTNFAREAYNTGLRAFDMTSLRSTQGMPWKEILTHFVTTPGIEDRNLLACSWLSAVAPKDISSVIESEPKGKQFILYHAPYEQLKNVLDAESITKNDIEQTLSEDRNTGEIMKLSFNHESFDEGWRRYNLKPFFTDRVGDGPREIRPELKVLRDNPSYAITLLKESFDDQDQKLLIRKGIPWLTDLVQKSDVLDADELKLVDLGTKCGMPTRLTDAVRNRLVLDEALKMPLPDLQSTLIEGTWLNDDFPDTILAINSLKNRQWNALPGVAAGDGNNAQGFAIDTVLELATRNETNDFLRRIKALDAESYLQYDTPFALAVTFLDGLERYGATVRAQREFMEQLVRIINGDEESLQ